MTYFNTHREQYGFTLIELMIVVVIVAILAAIAYPSYTEFVRRSARSEAKSALLENAQFMERNFTMANRYNADSAGNAINDASLPVNESPRDGTARYTMSVAPTALGYELRATPVAGGPAAGDPCGVFVLDNTGRKDLESNTRSEDECWNR